MARTKQPKAAKSKMMYKPYNAADVPDIMPFPALALVATTKGEETAVPKLNDHQHSWILDVALRDADLPSLEGKPALEFYEQVKTDAFDSKVFKHAPPEESQSPSSPTPSKKSNSPDGDGGASDDEEDEGGRTGLLRGYTKAGWRLAIQKVISNKCTADKRKTEASEKETTHAKESIGERSALSKLIGLANYTGRDKFRDEHHDDILEYSRTLDGGNPGFKFRKAENLMWTEEDQASWQADADSNDGVNWKERQTLVATGFKNMANNLHASRKFRPFVANIVMGWLNEDGQTQLEWQVVHYTGLHATYGLGRIEAVPDDIHVHQTFLKQHPKLVEESLNAMYAWADKPLKDYVAAREESPTRPLPVFPLSAEELDDKSHKVLIETVTTFLAESYQAAFGTGDIPWGALAHAPDEFYDAAVLPFQFPSTGLTDLSRNEWHELGTTLASVAGAGTLAFFRKAPVPLMPPPRPSRSPSLERAPTPTRGSAPPPSRPSRSPSPARAPTPVWRGGSTLLHAARCSSPGSPHTCPGSPTGPRRVAPAHLMRVVSVARVKLRISAESLNDSNCKGRAMYRIGAVRALLASERQSWTQSRAREEGDGVARSNASPPPAKRGKKRKVDDKTGEGLVPEAESASGRPKRARKTPAEALQERQEKAAAEAQAPIVPLNQRYTYIAKSPVKPKATKKSYVPTQVRDLNLSGQNLSAAYFVPAKWFTDFSFDKT
ncbi:hypothetical protein DFH09DRAFT_1096526 [Mycena vulgaris]|nr:hypothetical protein DFH09DRAFT_1096526 [Mycena vulgaris]